MPLIDLAAPGIAGLTPYQPGKSIEDLQREFGVSDCVKLASNENPFGPAPNAVAALRELAGRVSVYPDGNGAALKAALARMHGVDAEGITLGNGSNEILELLARLLLTPGKAALFTRHAFAVYPIVTQSAGAEAVVTPLQAESYDADLPAMLERIDERARVVFLANPNNPTGNWITADALHDFIAATPREVIVTIDEAYYEYAVKAGYESAVQWVGAFPNLLVMRTFSKVYGLAGLRIGYAVSQPELAELLNRIRQPFNTSSMAQAAALAALADSDHVKMSRERNLAGMRQLESALTELGLSFIPSAGNFICFHVGRDAAPVYERLLRQGVIIRPVANYGLPEYMRVTIGSADENARFIDALKQSLRAP